MILFWNHFIDYLEKGTLPKLQREARRLILRSADDIVIKSLLYHRRNAKCSRTFDHKPKYQLVLPKILIKPVLEIRNDSPMGWHGGIQNTVDLLSENFYFDKLPYIVSEYVQSCHDCQTRKMTRAHTIWFRCFRFQSIVRVGSFWFYGIFDVSSRMPKGNDGSCLV
jgi:hypothetical protein